MMNGRLRAGLVIAAIALSSAVAGAALDRVVVQRMRRRPPGGGPGRGSPEQEARRRTDMLDRMTKDLGLTEAQRAGIDSVMRRTDSSLHVIRTEVQPRLEQEFEKSRTDISARLTADQREKLAKAGRRGGRGSGGPRPR